MSDATSGAFDFRGSARLVSQECWRSLCCTGAHMLKSSLRVNIWWHLIGLVSLVLISAEFASASADPRVTVEQEGRRSLKRKLDSDVAQEPCWVSFKLCAHQNERWQIWWRGKTRAHLIVKALFLITGFPLYSLTKWFPLLHWAPFSQNLTLAEDLQYDCSFSKDLPVTWVEVNSIHF